jgi:hypothetical protein
MKAHRLSISSAVSGIHSLDQVKYLNGLLDFVSLQVTYTVPSGFAADHLKFLLSLLNVVLTTSLKPLSRSSRISEAVLFSMRLRWSHNQVLLFSVFSRYQQSSSDLLLVIILASNSIVFERRRNRDIIQIAGVNT